MESKIYDKSSQITTDFQLHKLAFILTLHFTLEYQSTSSFPETLGCS